jgi:hypothetical protein
MLTSRFPIHTRSAGSSLVYTGGIAISFVSHLLLWNFTWNKRIYNIIYFAMILGAYKIFVAENNETRP